MNADLIEFCVGNTIPAAIAGSVLYAFLFIFFLKWAVPRAFWKWIWLLLFLTFWMCPVLRYAKGSPESKEKQSKVSQRYEQLMRVERRQVSTNF